MKVLLAGYNLDADIINEMKEKSGWTKDNITPETLSASYARISRDPRNINELRKDAREETDKARKSNENIIFGLGHSSVAEHAVFNFDIIGLSRLAVEEVQQYRLASFTEKSQRYITLDGDYVLPQEIAQSNYADEFNSLIKKQNTTYFQLYEKLKEHLFKKHADMMQTARGKNTVDGWAKEDARYVLSLATESQFGMTVNGRTLEYMLRRFRSCPLQEIRDLAEKLFSHVAKLAPSIIKYTEPTSFDNNRLEELKQIVETHMSSDEHKPSSMVELLYATPDIDVRICADILFRFSNSSLQSCIEKTKNMSDEELRQILLTAISHRACWDRVDRSFEIGDFIFDVIVSSTNYAQLKRHRMCSQIVQDYDTNLGYTIPPAIEEIGMLKSFQEIMEQTDEFYHKIADYFPVYKNYILTNAHRRRVRLKMNLRELYHFISLREDEHAQWDIRNTAIGMKQLAEKHAPIAAAMLVGKSNFECKKNEVFTS